jgi:cyclopropane-fatty-acyl-phospholipid synthase
LCSTPDLVNSIVVICGAALPAPAGSLTLEINILGSAGRLAGFKRFLVHARERLGLDIGFVLWDGSTIPVDWPATQLAIAFANEGVIAGLVRKPNLDTLVNAWASGLVDIRNGTIFDLAAIRPRTATREFRKNLDKWLAITTLVKFLFISRGGPWPLEHQKSDKPSDGSFDENKKNIAFHYDLSNAFYALWLDREMVYTCGYCSEWDDDLDQMQQNKLEIICRKLRLKSGERLLDLGCGWGALSCYAAQHYGVTAYAVTLSEQQVAYGREKIQRLGLQDKVTIELKDYSAVEGEFDKVAAIGLQEHVGLNNHRKYYATVYRLLKYDGLFLQQATTRPAKLDDKTFRRKRPEIAVLTKYVFPGGEHDHIGNTLAMLQRSGFEVHDVDGWREHYQRTCKLWHDRLLANYAAAIAEVGGVMTRLFVAYLAASSIAFERNGACLYQTLSSKRKRGPSGLPPTRAGLYDPPV